MEILISVEVNSVRICGSTTKNKTFFVWKMTAYVRN